MQFKPLLEAIEGIIKESAANTLIKAYRHYVIEPGVHSVPVIVLGTTRGLKLEEEYLGDSAGSHPVLWSVTLGVSCLTRRYPLPAQVVKAAEAVDALQAAVFTALNDDPKQGDACAQSWIESVKEVGFLSGEYVGYELILILQKFEA